MYEDILLDVKRPGQYIGKEWNSSGKDFDNALIKFALIFPDLYEIGMSNLGVRIIYGLLNGISDSVCERFFAPDIDLEKILRLNKREILSLDSRRRLMEFDLAGFSLGSELGYTNALNILDLARLPLRARERGHNYPLVIAGGPCTLNPEPMHDFFDFFVIGEAEELLLEVTDTYRKYKDAYKSGKMPKSELLCILSKIEGVYAPSLYDVDYDGQGAIKRFAPNREGVPLKIKKRFVRDLNSSYFPKDWIVPNVQIVHDRVTLEVMRGCPNRCRFCQARSHYFPLRYRNQDAVVDLADSLYKCSGYEELSLSGLSVSDYPCLEGLLTRLISLFRPRGVSLSLPSIKAKLIIGKVSSLIAKFKKTGLTFAPEAGSEGLRDLLAKDFNSEDFFQALKEAYSCGYQHVKLYFMIGIPGEKDEDLDAIIDFSAKASDLRKELKRPSATVNLSVSNLIPKPHTPLQWAAMIDLDNMKRSQDYIREKSLKRKRLKISFHNRKMSFLEGVFSRGDRRLSEVVLNAFNKGARFDAWNSSFDFDIWDASFRDAGIDPYFYLKEKAINEFLPWDFIETGVDKAFLAEEFNKTIAR
ncbi:MAG: TIGR03960 family B12-binding radical SAM protein [Candidatus Omnitrophota bacterium]|jgi:radical SAM family uncharacterized protein